METKLNGTELKTDYSCIFKKWQFICISYMNIQITLSNTVIDSIMS